MDNGYLSLGKNFLAAETVRIMEVYGAVIFVRVVSIFNVILCIPCF